MADPFVIKQVIEYLSKKGYTKTEATLRAESASQEAESKPMVLKNEDLGGDKYRLGYGTRGRSVSKLKQS